MTPILCGLALVAAALAPVQPAAPAGPSHAAVQARVDADLAAERPVVIHVTVALCDNAHQGIVPVPKALGDGRDPKGNLYWGAAYGVRTHLGRKGAWTVLAAPAPPDARILQRVVFHRKLPRGARTVDAYLVADAWDGAHMRAALTGFLDMSAGRAPQEVKVQVGGSEITLPCGGSAHLTAFVGHNGLMDFDLPASPAHARTAGASASMVLACASRPYFRERLQTEGSHPVLLTTGLMAPEAYTLDAAACAWVRGGDVGAVREAAAAAYNSYQKCGMRAARNLFATEP